SAEDVVQDVFTRLCARGRELDQVSALAYIRTAVVNGCRSVLRRRALARRIAITRAWPWRDPQESAEPTAILADDRRRVLAAVAAPGAPQRRGQPAGGRWRRPAWAAPVAAGIAVLLVIGLAVSVSNRLFGTQQPAGPAHLPPAPRQFNPLIPNVSFGWLPAGESLGQGGVRRTDVYLAAGRPPGLLGWGLSVYARGRCHLTGSPRGVKCSTQGLSGV